MILAVFVCVWCNLPLSLQKTLYSTVADQSSISNIFEIYYYQLKGVYFSL